jgi:hypothetical protein
MDRGQELDLIATYLRTRGATILRPLYQRQISSARDKPKGEVYVNRKPSRFRSKLRRK